MADIIRKRVELDFRLNEIDIAYIDGDLPGLIVRALEYYGLGLEYDIKEYDLIEEAGQMNLPLGYSLWMGILQAIIIIAGCIWAILEVTR